MKAEWERWEQVTKYITPGHKLYRASAPNYNEGEGDRSQKLTATAVKFLTDRGVDSIISFNQYPYKDDEKKLLDAAKISYLHLPVKDFTAPTLAQLKSAIIFFTGPKQHATLVHCGYGHGRTGTGVTALQLNATKGVNPPESEWKSQNHVEKLEQEAVLRALRDSLRG
ncbi:hypothetical protein BKA93DRAFT_824798 [Sparassis latifolia]